MKHWRTNLIFVLIILFSATVIGRLIYIQIIQKDYWQALAQGQQRFFAQVQGERGEIFFRNREPLAINRNFDLVFISSKKIKDPEETAKRLSKILNLDENLILEKITQENSFYELIKNRLTQEEVANLKKLDLPGIYLGRKNLRYYPQQFLASQVIGFFGGEEKGQYGIEGYYDQKLEGEEGFEEGKRTAWGYLLKSSLGGVEKGADLILTLDYNIQFMAEKLLETAYENFDIKGGQIIVMEPDSGKILALADFPNFNPNQFAEEENFEIFKNSATQKLFEPGSVLKPITIAAAINQGKITPETVYVDKGVLNIDGWSIRNYADRTWGEQTMTGVLEKSINTGAVFAQQQIEPKVFLNYLEKFGFFEATGIDLQGEVFSQNLELKRGREVNFATASFGQGIAITPIQLVKAFSAIANKGKLVRPYIVERIIQNGEEIEIKPEVLENSIISQQTSSQLTAMMVEVVEHLFTRRAQIPGYYVAGKTGTAQVPWAALGYDRAGYSDQLMHTFVGFAPAFNPQFLILVNLNNPQGVRTASVSVAPIFQKLAKYIINLRQIPPDYEE